MQNAQNSLGKHTLSFIRACLVIVFIFYFRFLVFKGKRKKQFFCFCFCFQNEKHIWLVVLKNTFFKNKIQENFWYLFLKKLNFFFLWLIFFKKIIFILIQKHVCSKVFKILTPKKNYKSIVLYITFKPKTLII